MVPPKLVQIDEPCASVSLKFMIPPLPPVRLVTVSVAVETLADVEPHAAAETSPVPVHDAGVQAIETDEPAGTTMFVPS